MRQDAYVVIAHAGDGVGARVGEGVGEGVCAVGLQEGGGLRAG